MNLLDIGSIIIAVIAALGAWASQRAAANASKVGSRMDAEKEAYERARKFDMDTIKRQDEEIKELRDELDRLKQRLQLIEERTPISMMGLEGILRDRIEGTDTTTDGDSKQ